MPRPPKLVDPNESPVHAFARIIIDGRRAAGWSRARLATEVNFGATYIGEVERAEKLPTLDVALSIARTLDLDCNVVEKAWYGATAHLRSTSGVGPLTEPLRTERRFEEPAALPHESRPSFKPSAGVMVVGGLVLVLALVMFLVAGPDAEQTAGPTTAPASAEGTRPTPPSSTTIPTTTTRPSRTFSDDFTRDRGWFVADNDNIFAAVADGHYRSVVRKLGSEYWAAEPEGSTASSQRVEVDAEGITSGRLTYGVGCRMGERDASGSTPHYAASISRTGYWNLLRYEGNGQRSPRVIAEAANRSEYSDAIRDTVNRLSLDCGGAGAEGAPVTLRFSVNGVRLVETVDAVGLGRGKVGVVVSSLDEPVEVRFDNFERTIL